MIDFNKSGFDTELEKFDSEMTSNKITCDQSSLENSSGYVISNMNSFLLGIDTLINNINECYSSTSAYLHKVSYNINLCEEENGSTP